MMQGCGGEQTERKQVRLQVQSVTYANTSQMRLWIRLLVLSLFYRANFSYVGVSTANSWTINIWREGQRDGSLHNLVAAGEELRGEETDPG